MNSTPAAPNQGEPRPSRSRLLQIKVNPARVVPKNCTNCKGLHQLQGEPCQGCPKCQVNPARAAPNQGRPRQGCSKSRQTPPGLLQIRVNPARALHRRIESIALRAVSCNAAELGFFAYSRGRSRRTPQAVLGGRGGVGILSGSLSEDSGALGGSTLHKRRVPITWLAEDSEELLEGLLALLRGLVSLSGSDTLL